MANLTPDQRAQLSELLSRIHLDAIQYHEIMARREETGRADGEDHADVKLEYHTRFATDDFGVRMTASVDTRYGPVVASVAAEYIVEEGEPPSRELLDLFASEVAGMAIYPYIREAVQSCTARVFDTSLTLPIMQRGSTIPTSEAVE